MDPEYAGKSRGARDLGELRWHCRRGMKELDVLLTRYVEQEFPAASPEHQQAFRDLLAAPDPLIFAYCLGLVPPPTAVMASLIVRIAGRDGAARRDR